MDDERDLFYETERRETGDVFQIRPFYWEQKDKYGTSWNILGPLIRYREDETFRRLQILPNMFYTERKQPQELKSWYFVFFPLLFVGNDDFVLLPFGGHSKGFLGFHDFLMVTPLYIRTRRVSSHPTDPVIGDQIVVVLDLELAFAGRTDQAGDRYVGRPLGIGVFHHRVGDALRETKTVGVFH